MLNEQRLRIFEELVKESGAEERIWMSGYLAALVGNSDASTPASAPSSQAKIEACTILYGSETGNSKKIAVELGNRAKKQGAQVKLKSLDQYRPNDLKKEKQVFLVVSTHGDGEPPEAARKFYDYVHTEKLELNDLKYGVLALGDSAYPLFCKTGEDLDAKLNELGASRIVPLQKCDTDFESDAQQWIEELLSAAAPQGEVAVAGTVALKPKTSGKKIYAGKILSNINLNDRGSKKITHHIEIETEDEIAYEPGDSIGIVAKNHPDVVARILSLLELEAHAPFTYKNQSYTAAELFSGKINLNYLPERVLGNYAKFVGQDIPVTRMDFVDLLRIYPPDASADKQALIDLLEPISPRLYSISSSPASHGETEIHVTVSQDRFHFDGQERIGFCSDYLTCLPEGESIDFYVQKNNAFKLPEADKDVVMIGPGTGIAPFRSFLFERDAQGADGLNWLFFGDQHFTSDFLYQTELQSLMETGVLTRLNTAFSRDQAEKVYVQHKMKHHAAELLNWLENGAHIYVCGAKEPMSHDVEQTLLNIIAEGKNISAESAQAYLNELAEAGRYVKDVY